MPKLVKPQERPPKLDEESAGADPSGASWPPKPTAGSSKRRPIYLLADSRLLFAPEGDGLSLRERLRADLPDPVEESSAAYLGASNGDEPAFYDIFEAAMDLLGITSRRHIPARPSAQDFDFLDQATLVLLAGGDVLLGWRAFETSGLRERVERRYRDGALVVGVSAGAVQLGRGFVDEEAAALIETFGLLPFLIDAHAEPEWTALRRALPLVPPTLGALGIPFGGGAAIAPDMTVEPIAKPLFELFRRGGVETQAPTEALLLPGDNSFPSSPAS